MSLFGPPNVDKIRKKGKIKKLVSLITNNDPDLASKALNALKLIVNDKGLEKERKKEWLAYEYENIFKKIEKLDSDKQASINQLTQILKEEKSELDKKAKSEKFERDILINRFEDSFEPLTGSRDKFYDDLWNILGENKEFLHTMRLMNSRAMGEFSGVIVTKDEIIYFELNVFHKILGIRLDEIREFKFGLLNANIKIKNVFGDYIKIPIDETDKELVNYIESRYKNNVEN
jgi:hypothetical protein